MKNWPYVTLLVLVCAGLVLAGCGSTGKVPVASAQSNPVEPRTPVEVATAATGNMAQVLTYAGSLQSKDSVRVTPLVSGRIATMPVAVGDALKAGDVIAQLEPDTFAAQKKQAEVGLQAAQLKLTRMQEGSRPEEIAAAEAGVRLAQASIGSATMPTDDQQTIAAANMARTESALKLAQHEYDKIAYAGQAGATPQVLQLEQATVAYQSAVASYNLAIKPTDGQLAPLQNQLAQAQLKLALTRNPYTETDLAMARAAVEQAKAALELAQAQLSYATIKAPFDGIVAEVYVSKGSLVGPQAPVVLFVSNSIEAVVDVEEGRIGQFQRGQSAAFRVAAFPGQDFQGGYYDGGTCGRRQDAQLYRQGRSGRSCRYPAQRYVCGCLHSGTGKQGHPVGPTFGHYSASRPAGRLRD
jgi:HlyD family secretion protein